MRAFLRFRPSPALVVASIALLVALTGTGIAAVQQLVPRNSVGTAQLREGAVTTSKLRQGSVTTNKIKNGSVGVRDLSFRAIRRIRVKGPRGATGPAGPAGAPGVVTRLWAVVNASGSIARGAGTTSAGRLGVGQYEVIFGQDVTNCSYIATVGDAGNISGNLGMAITGRRPGNANGVRVNTRSQTGPAADRGFHLLVVC